MENMGLIRFKAFMCFALVGIGAQIAAQNDMNVSVFTITSKSITVSWTGISGATSYKVTATPKHSPGGQSFSQFGQYSVMGTVNSLSPNTLYIMVVEAMDNDFNVLSQGEVEETTAPDVPSIIQAYSKQSDSITVEFTRMVGATAYIIRVETETETFFSESEVSDSPGTVINLEPYTEYVLSVMSVSPGRRSQPSWPKKARTVVSAPKLESSSPNNSSIHLTWEQVEHASLYTLCIIMEGSDTRIKLNTTNTSMNFTGLESGTTYCIKGNAWDPESNAGDDFTVCQITRPSNPTVTQVMLAAGRVHVITVQWRAVRGAEHYLALSSIGQNCTSSDTSCIIGPVGCGQNHSITVTAFNKAGRSSPSDPEEFITFPCAPQSLLVKEPVPGNCTVSWSEVSWVDYYLVFIKWGDGTEKQCNTTNTECNYHCDCGFTYLMTVFAYNKAGSSPPGMELNHTTVPCCPKDVSVSVISTDTLEIMWTAVRGADVYETKAGDMSDVILCNDTAPLCALSDLRCDTNYSVVVRPCSEISGCNNTCQPHTQETAPCTPEHVGITQINATSVKVTWISTNKGAKYTANLVGKINVYSCQSAGTFCEVSSLPCGSTYEVSVVASTPTGLSLPTYTVPLETAPCCPERLTVTQVTQAMTNVTWSAATGAQSFVTALASRRGNAKCHTLDTHCLMGCITCGTNYTVSMEAFSRTGHKSECHYHGFSSSPCCPTSVKLYRMSNNTIRVYWRSSSNLSNYTANLYGTISNYTCSPVSPGGSYCDVSEIVCGDVYTVVAAPLSPDGTKIKFCTKRMYSVPCSGSNFGMVIYRGNVSGN